ncbi:MAG: Asp-tRNA(Asn)/Glu-tRNA(Gln) amidotransferase subunit GatB [Gammaproteobacteria bacterium]|nr:Asp-tRNA(Asn)/Glu-tRNA(Gln) amidotransferase subunit GatB [Gammaproteobacteria bacterium]
MQYEPTIGLEIHVQLSTASKMFSGAATAYGGTPNSQACAVDLGLPGVLPVINAEAVRMAILFGLAIDAEIAPRSVFARKNYFYPDLPKGYQISQFELPVVARGHLDIATEDGETIRIRITRAHLEEDAGKSLHEDFHGMTGIDLNRAGTPLLEVVTEPDLTCASDAVAYMRALHTLVRYLGICDGNMQEGSFRCDANVSVKPIGSTTLGTRAEIKNLNSFRFVERAINYEIERQVELLESGGKVVQETRLYDPDRDETRSMRSKEDAQDYRYFPDPDLLPLDISKVQIDAMRELLPELPRAREQRFEHTLGLHHADAVNLARDRAVADYLEATISAGGDPRSAANWILGEVFGAMNKDGMAISEIPVKSEMLAELLSAVSDGTISGKIAKEVFEAMWQGEGRAREIIERRGLRQVNDTGAIMAFVDQVIAANPEQVEQLKSGKDKVLGFLVGQIMKLSKGKANPQQVNELLRQCIFD